jgi:hypothetical protein
MTRAARLPRATARVAVVLFALALTSIGPAVADDLDTFMQVPRPGLSGSAAVGGTLYASFDTAAVVPAPDAVLVEWVRNGSVVATGDTYQLVPADRGTVISVRVTVSKAGFADHRSSSVAQGPIAYGTQSFSVTISGTPGVNYVLKAGGLPAGATYTYQWLSDGKAITGATASTFKPAKKHVGHHISVRVRAKKPGYTTLTKTSKPTAAIKRSFHIVTRGPIGVYQVGHTLNVQRLVTPPVSMWSPQPTTLKYQWYADGVAIPGATKGTFALTASQVSKTMSVVVTGSRSGFITTSARYAEWGQQVKLGALAVKTPTISGKAKVGNTLTGAYSASTPVQDGVYLNWFCDGVACGTGSTLTLTSDMVGKRIVFRVGYHRAGYVTKSVESAATAAVIE